MSTIEKRFRRNFVVACLVHAALIGGIIVFEGAFRRAQSNAPIAVELITPADILGDLPTGTGNGRGAYTAPPPEPAHQPEAAPAGPAEAPATPEPPVAPKAKVAPPETTGPNEIAVPKKQAAKESKKTAETTAKKRSPVIRPSKSRHRQPRRRLRRVNRQRRAVPAAPRKVRRRFDDVLPAHWLRRMVVLKAATTVRRVAAPGNRSTAAWGLPTERRMASPVALARGRHSGPITCTFTM